ncbi:hypothetical protein NliqN6_6438 [Naganishia liquefaciens]|uniref:Uncharacterized protein n=1 Tax=Naganishia liquefaciens TaxID=104408 RepID=A0A8H3U003_9TREE|nr:hypothetical protein NliqN6_6438 [Naganishia liquefaciens]
MDTSYSFPHLAADPSFSFAPAGTRLPAFRPSDARYDAELRKVLGGQGESLAAQEERVYRAEKNISDFGEHFLIPPGRRQTQAEMDVAHSRSATPEDPHALHTRQEDTQVEEPTVEEEEDDDEEEEQRQERDLDDEMEDRDASEGDESR